MASRERATSSAGARSKASGTGRERAAAPTAAAKPAAGGGRSKPAVLTFHAGWREELQGSITPGGKLRVEYATERLPDFRATHRSKPTWDIVGTVLFSPGGQLETGSVVKKPLEVVVPKNASKVTLWFQNTDGSGGAAWDSRYGDNYHFDIAIPPPAPAAPTRARPRAKGTAPETKSSTGTGAQGRTRAVSEPRASGGERPIIESASSNRARRGS